MTAHRGPDLRIVESGFGVPRSIDPHSIDAHAVVRATLQNSRASYNRMSRLLEAQERNELLNLIAFQPRDGQSFSYPRVDHEDLFWEMHLAGFRFCDRYQLIGDVSERAEIYLRQMSYPQMFISGPNMSSGRFYAVIVDQQGGRPGCYALHIGLLGKRDGRYFVESGHREVFLEDGMALLVRDLYPDKPKPPGGNNMGPVEEPEEELRLAA